MHRRTRRSEIAKQTGRHQRPDDRCDALHATQRALQRALFIRRNQFGNQRHQRRTRDAANAQMLEGKLQDALVTRDALKQEVDATPPMLVAAMIA